MSTPRFGRFSVFFPMWNEEEYLQRALNAATELGEELLAAGTVGDYEMIIVNDASTDATPRLADEAARLNPRVKVVHHPTNRKLGGSIKSGFAAATGDVVLYTDADLPFDMAEIGKALRVMRLYESDIVSAYRLDRTGEGSLRIVYTFVYNTLIRRLFGVRMQIGRAHV